jgi:arylsulfatase A-like enzyme
MNNGQGTAIRTDGMGLPFEAYTLPEMLHEHGLAPWTTAAVGKWHIAGRGRGADNPLTHGFDRFAGTMGNIMPGTGEDYYGWRRLEDLESVWTTTYATTDAADTAIRYMAEMPEPWFVWLAFHAVHSPWQMPPDDLHDTSFTDASPTADRYDAMLIALDRELGRTLDALTPEVRARTTVIVLGDNGTPEFAVRPPLDPLMAKGTVYEGGVHVPMIVQGPMVEQPGRWVEGIVSQVDLFPTVAELGGIDLPRDVWDELDGKSLMPMLARPGAVVREHAYSEYFSPNGRDAASRDVWARSVRDERWRFVRRLQGREELYDLADGPAEGVDLAASITDPSQTLPGEAGEALERMRALLDSYEPRP